MSLSDLLKKHMVEKVDPDDKRAADLLESTGRDLKTASDNLRLGHPEWALAISYNAMLSAGMALMAQMGYRPFTESHHLAVVRFCASVLPLESAPLAEKFNRYRMRRHDVIYGEPDSVGEEEAKRALATAEKFVELIKTHMKKK